MTSVIFGTMAIAATTVLLLGGCVAARSEPPRVVASQAAGPSLSRDESGPLLRYHSKRLRLSLPLPRGREWRIDDHSRPELVAAQAATRSRVVVALFRADALVGRAQCEELARAHNLVPLGELRTLEDAVGITQESFDTRVWVAIESAGDPNGAVVGHVMAFGGFLRKCYVFDYSTAVDGASDEPILSSRLAVARTRILGGLELDPPGGIARTVPPPAVVRPEPAQAH